MVTSYGYLKSRRDPPRQFPAPPGGGRIDFFDTTRVGRIIGPDLTERLARTFHCNFGSIKVGGNFRDALDYARRQGDYAKVEDGKMAKLQQRLDEAREAGDEKVIAKRAKALEHAEARNAKAAEFEAEAGDPEAVLKAADRIEETARVRSGRTAERVVATEVWELPGDSTAEQRRAAAGAIVEHWRSQGHEAHAAVHGNGVVQPHMHVTATARPILAGAVDRSRLLWPTKQDVRDAREDRAELVNRHCPGAVLFDGGRHEAVGIDRKARREAGLMQRRLPRHARHREESFERTRRDDAAPARQAGRYKASREALPARKAEAAAVVQERAAAREADRAARKEARREQARKRDEKAKKREREAAELTEKQTALITDLHREAGRALPDLASERGQSEAWAFARAELAAQRPDASQTQEADDGERRSEGSRPAGGARTEAGDRGGEQGHDGIDPAHPGARAGDRQGGRDGQGGPGAEEGPRATYERSRRAQETDRGTAPRDPGGSQEERLRAAHGDGQALPGGEGLGGRVAGTGQAAPLVGDGQPGDQGGRVAGDGDAAPVDAVADLVGLVQHHSDEWERMDNASVRVVKQEVTKEKAVAPPPARPWKDLTDDELVNRWSNASRRSRMAQAPEDKADAVREIKDLHAEAGHRNTTLKALDAQKQRREDRGR